MKVVKFHDGTYAVRRWVPFFYEYLDNCSSCLFNTHWWSLEHVKNSKVNSYEAAVRLKTAYEERTRKAKLRRDSGTPVTE